MTESGHLLIRLLKVENVPRDSRERDEIRCSAKTAFLAWMT